MTAFWEGDHVDYVGDGLDGLPPAQGKIMSIASQTAVHVAWETGPRAGQYDIVDIRDLEKSAAAEVVAAPTITAGVLVRRVMHNQGTGGVLQYLASTNQLGTWETIADQALAFVESRLRIDASMELPYETLAPDEIDQVIRTSALTLLRDKFSAQEAQHG